MSSKTTTAATLAARKDFALGLATVRPSLCEVAGPAGNVSVEPRVMRVLTALADARGQVLSREDLLQECWDGRIVGDDAINRAVSEVRRIAKTVDAGFAVETVPRIGYRLTGVDWNDDSDDPPPLQAKPSRRKFMAGSAAAAIVVTGSTIAFVRHQRSSEIDALLTRGRDLQALGTPAGRAQAEALFRKAVNKDPGRADAWGWLAAVLDEVDPARDAAMRALQLDKREPNARAVLAVQQLDIDAWTKWEDVLLGVLQDAPSNTLALEHLAFFYQGVGRCRDSWNLHERLLRYQPLNVQILHKRAFQNWNFGRINEADRIADRGMDLRPRDGVMWNARMLIYACTDRAQAGLALLDDVGSRPANLTQPSIDSWRLALTAIGSRSSSDIARAVDSFAQVAPLAPGLAANAVMMCSYLGAIDDAYRFAHGLLVNRGTLVQRVRGGSINDVYSGTGWGRTQFLFIPATVNFRADARFSDLCQRIGHVAYWRKRGIWPDTFVRGSIDPAKLV